MRDRCYRKTHVYYKYYGGKGIKICDEWIGKNGFKHFYEWALNNGWNPLLTIDRIDPDGDYSPDNCRWIDYVEQANNRKHNHYLALRGETHTAAEWARILNWNPDIIYGRIRLGWDDEKILTEPVVKKKLR